MAPRPAGALRALGVACLLLLAGCEGAGRRVEAPREEAVTPFPIVGPEQAIDRIAGRVPELVRDPADARVLLEALENARGALEAEDHAGARGAILGFVAVLDELVAGGGVPPLGAGELLGYAGAALGTIGYPPLCIPDRPPVQGLRYVKRTCVSRLEKNPADPEKPLAPDAVEHCNPVIRNLQLAIQEKGLGRCVQGDYACIPVDPAACTTICRKDIVPGFAGGLPRIRFIPNAPDCADDPVNKHACSYEEFYGCACSCAGVEDI